MALLVKGIIPLVLAATLGASAPEFEKNIGQADSVYLYLARLGSTRVYVEDHAIAFASGSGPKITLSWTSAAPSGWSIAEPSGNVTHYCNQQSVELCKQAVPGYKRISKRGLYPATDWSIYGGGEHLEYDLIVHPGGKVENALFRVEGAEARVEADGGLLAGDVLQWRPAAYQWIGGKRVDVAAAFQKRGDSEFGFSVGPHREDLDLIVDPVITTIAVVGGANDDAVIGTLSNSSCVSQYGITLSAGWSQIPTAGHSVFVRFSSPQGGATQTFFWGGAGDSLIGGASGSCANLYLVGWTSAQNAPIMTDPYSTLISQPYAGGASDGFFLEFANETLLRCDVSGRTRRR